MRYLQIPFYVFCLAVCATSTPDAVGQESLTDKFLNDANGMAFEVNLSKLLKSKDFRPAAELIDISGNLKRQTGIAVTDIELFATTISGPNEEPFRKFVLKTSRDIDALQLMRLNRWLRPNEVPDTKQYRDKTYYTVETRRGEIGIYQPDDKTMVVNTSEGVEDFVKGKTPKQVLLKSKEWKELSEYHARFAIGEDLFEQWRAEYKRFFEQGRPPADPVEELLLPLNQKVQSAYGGLKLDDQLSLRVSLFTKNSSDAKEVISSLEAGLQIGKTMLAASQDAIIASARDEASQKIAREGFVVLKKFIDSLEMERIGKEVRITASADVRSYVRNILPDAINSARIAARRTQSANNMKQLGLSMHNYHDTHKGMPPAVIIGPKGHKHSWRVAMLPYLEQVELYKQYKFDEPWDSPNNKKVMNQMPDVFRHPNDPPGSTNTRYLAFVGPGTPFENPEGVQFRDIIDGSSNTVMFFSGASNVPWTKPEDIDYDPTKDLDIQDGPFKEGFNAVFFDGSVQFITKEMLEKQGHRLIQMADGNPIER